MVQIMKVNPPRNQWGIFQGPLQGVLEGVSQSFRKSIRLY